MTASGDAVDGGGDVETGFEDVLEVDAFAKAKVVNFLNRRAPDGKAGKAATDVELRAVRVGDDTHHHGTHGRMIRELLYREFRPSFLLITVIL